MRGEMLTVMNADGTEKFTATADLLDGPKGSFGYFADPGKVTAPPA